MRSFSKSLYGVTVLNAELLSMNSMLTYVFLPSKCVRAVWVAALTASSVDRFCQYANCKWSKVAGMFFFNVGHDYPSRTLHHNWGECNVTIVIQAGQCFSLEGAQC